MRQSAKTENHVFSRFSSYSPTFAHKFTRILCATGLFITRCKTSESQFLRVWLSVRCALSDASALRFPAGLLRAVCDAPRRALRSLRLAHGVLCPARVLHWRQPGGVVGAGLCPRRKKARCCRTRKQDGPLRGWYATAGRDRRSALSAQRSALRLTLRLEALCLMPMRPRRWYLRIAEGRATGCVCEPLVVRPYG